MGNAVRDSSFMRYGLPLSKPMDWESLPMVEPVLDPIALAEIGGHPRSWWLDRLAQIDERDIDMIATMIERFARMGALWKERKSGQGV
jgi:hypothetical protein